ncbi:MAG: hypothetical protein L6Q54_09045 [Leptospiraceae bacterium]|nr:hypothetical protein [Leptospiraceae bacterium]
MRNQKNHTHSLDIELNPASVNLQRKFVLYFPREVKLGRHKVVVAV